MQGMRSPASRARTLARVAAPAVRKRFVGSRPNTSYKATAAGAKAFRAHIDAFERLLNKDLRR